MSGDPVSDVLNRAADRLEQPGVWAQGVRVSSSFSHDCLITAIGRAIPTDLSLQERCRLLDAVDMRLEQVLSVSGGEAQLEWNEVPGRKAAEVVTALRQAAQLRAAE